MSVFSDSELSYLSEGKLGRLATVDPDGVPHVVPLGWSYNANLDTVDIGGRDFARTRKFRNVRVNSRVALVVDDVIRPGFGGGSRVWVLGQTLGAARLRLLQIGSEGGGRFQGSRST